jgi:hypothetical protein
LLRGLLDEMSLNDSQTRTILEQMVALYKDKDGETLMLMPRSTFEYSNAEVASLRRFLMPMSANQIVKLDQFERERKGIS